VVQASGITTVFADAGWPGQGVYGWQRHYVIMAQRCDGFQRRLTSALRGSFVVLLEKDGARRRSVIT
jgi:hypothetical protein